MKRPTFLLFLVLLAACLIGAPVHAAEDRFPKPDITVSPAITEWILKPGSVQTKTIKVTNPKTSPIPMRVVAEALTTQEEVADQDHTMYDASSWFNVDDEYFILQGKETRSVKVTLRVPANAEPGGHYATIYFQQFVPAGTVARTTVAAQVGSLALITVEGKLVPRLATSGAITETRQDDGSINLGIALHNDGNIHLMPTGRFIVSDWQGRTVATLPLPTGIILPHTTRIYTTTWNKPPSIGYYTVYAEITYDTTSHPLTSVRGFWHIPGGEIFITILLATAIWWCGFRIRHRWIKAIKLLLKS